MGTVTRLLPVAIDRVFATLADPETYPHWLLGARDIRDIDDGWPAAGSQFHHRVGLSGPLKVADTTEVLAIDAPTLLSLEVRARPFLRAKATFRLTADEAAGTPSTLVSITEEPIGPYAVLRPLIGPFTDARNKRSLADLDDLLRSGRSHRAPG
jgi:uncharacterized protein YndB with AHSA1/START domain